MNKKDYDYAVETFQMLFNREEYVINALNFEKYFRKDGERDKRKKYFTIEIFLKTLRRFDLVENARIIGEAFKTAHAAMKQAEENTEGLIFNGFYYDGVGKFVVKFARVSEVALNELTADATRDFYVEKW
jgi:hypothetical protein